jgi:hypothetical protein
VHLLSPSAQLSNAPEASLELPADLSGTESGRYEATYVMRDAGAYSVDAVVTQPDGQLVGRAEAGWSADPAVDEFRSLKPNRALLDTIAHRTGGEIVPMEDLRKFVRGLPQRAAPITETAAQPLWRQPAIFFFALVCFLADWGLRRWKGLP